MGVSKVLKKNFKNISIVAVEPKNSPILSKNISGAHQIQGIGAGFIPSIVDKNIFDEIITVSDEEAFDSQRELAKKYGILSGISSGASFFATKIYAKKLGKGKKILFIAPDDGQRYLSTKAF